MKLCYVDLPWLYFTDDMDNVWGDDWDDAPYQHNAGRPYPDYIDSVVAIKDSGLFSPSSSRRDIWISVEEINAGRVPWLKTPEYSKKNIVINAGEKRKEVIQKVSKAAGKIYIERPGSTY